MLPIVIERTNNLVLPYKKLLHGQGLKFCLIAIALSCAKIKQVHFLKLKLFWSFQKSSGWLLWRYFISFNINNRIMFLENMLYSLKSSYRFDTTLLQLIQVSIMPELLHVDTKLERKIELWYAYWVTG